MRPAASRAAGAQPAAPAERVVARLRRHARMLILPALLLVATTGAATYFALVLPEAWQRIAVGGVALLVVVLGSLAPFLAWLTRRTTITTRRIILRNIAEHPFQLVPWQLWAIAAVVAFVWLGGPALLKRKVAKA